MKIYLNNRLILFLPAGILLLPAGLNAAEPTTRGKEFYVTFGEAGKFANNIGSMSGLGVQMQIRIVASKHTKVRFRYADTSLQGWDETVDVCVLLRQRRGLLVEQHRR